MKTYKVYIRSQSQFDIVFVNSASEEEVTEGVIKRFPTASILRVVEIY